MNYLFCDHIQFLQNVTIKLNLNKQKKSQLFLQIAEITGNFSFQLIVALIIGFLESFWVIRWLRRR